MIVQPVDIFPDYREYEYSLFFRLWYGKYKYKHYINSLERGQQK